MKSTNCGPLLWRLLVACSFLVPLALMLLPWIKVCDDTYAAGANPSSIAKDKVADFLQSLDRLFSGSDQVVISQTGLQATYGDCSIVGVQPSSCSNRVVDSPAPLMHVFVVLSASGCCAALYCKTGTRRRIAILRYCCVTAWIVLWIQMLAGFPLSEAIAKENLELAVGLAEPTTSVRYTAWFYLSHLAALASLLLIAVESRLCSNSRSKLAVST